MRHGHEKKDSGSEARDVTEPSFKDQGLVEEGTLLKGCEFDLLEA